VWDIAKWPVLLAVVVVMIALLYYASPNARLRGVMSILPGAQLNAERERSRQLEAGTPGAERELQLDQRSEAKAKRRARTV
jgi:membrane protein